MNRLVSNDFVYSALTRLVTVFAFISISLVLSAQAIQATGYGTSEESARSNALANLSQYLYVNVKASITEVSGEIDNRVISQTLKEVQAVSNLPLLGMEFSPLSKKGREYAISASLTPSKSMPLYKDRIEQIYQDLLSSRDFLQPGAEASLRYDKLQKARMDAEDFELYHYIYRALGGTSEYRSPLSTQEIDEAIFQLKSSYEDLSLALQQACKDFSSFSDIYVLYPSVYPGNETTQLSRIIHDHLLAMLSGTTKAEQSSYILRSGYEICDSSIVLSLRLTDKNGNTKRGHILKLHPKAYQGYGYLPKTLDLASLYESGELVSNKLQVQLSGMDGSPQLFFTKGEVVRLRIKTNLPIEYYITVHSHNDDGIYSYLLLGAGITNRMSADQCNRWIELQEFEVSEPFGVETLQLIASTGSLQSSLPPARYDSRYGLDKISDNPKDAMVLTRGLKPVAREIETTETTLTITTMER